MQKVERSSLSDHRDLISIRDFVRWAISCFNEAGLSFGHGTDNAYDEAHWLIAHALHLNLPLHEALLPCRITPSERDRILDLVRCRVSERKPAAYLTGQAWFAGLEFVVDESVMIPRSPIAELIEQGFAPWVEADAVQRVLDLCCGSGCIGLATAVYLPQVQVDLVDRSAAALAIARQNVRSLAEGVGLDERVRLVESDLFRGLHGCCYDLIVSNPPYVPRVEFERLPPEYRHEPTAAFVAGENGLELVLRILLEAPEFLTERGALVLEVGHTAEALEDLLPDVPFLWLEFEHGGYGVFLLHRDELMDYHDAFVRAMAAS